MATWKDQSEKMSAFRGEAVKERRLIQEKAHWLEKEALALSEEVRMAMKRGKTLSSAELKGIQKLLKKTVKTAKSTSTRGEPEERPAPPPEIISLPLPPPPPPAPPAGQAGGAPERPQPPPELTAPGPGPERRKENEVGPPEKPPRGDRAAQDPSESSSSSSSSSSNSDDTGDGTMESLLRHRRQE